MPDEVKEALKGYAVKALRVVIDMMNDDRIEPAVRLRAAQTVLDRAYGKVPQPVTGEDGGPLTWKLVEAPLVSSSPETWSIQFKP